MPKSIERRTRNDAINPRGVYSSAQRPRRIELPPQHGHPASAGLAPLQLSMPQPLRPQAPPAWLQGRIQPQYHHYYHTCHPQQQQPWPEPPPDNQQNRMIQQQYQPPITQQTYGEQYLSNRLQISSPPCTDATKERVTQWLDNLPTTEAEARLAYNQPSSNHNRTRSLTILSSDHPMIETEVHCQWRLWLAGVASNMDSSKQFRNGVRAARRYNFQPFQDVIIQAFRLIIEDIHRTFGVQVTQEAVWNILVDRNEFGGTWVAFQAGAVSELVGAFGRLTIQELDLRGIDPRDTS